MTPDFTLRNLTYPAMDVLNDMISFTLAISQLVFGEAL